MPDEIYKEIPVVLLKVELPTKNELLEVLHARLFAPQQISDFLISGLFCYIGCGKTSRVSDRDQAQSLRAESGSCQAVDDPPDFIKVPAFCGMEQACAA